MFYSIALKIGIIFNFIAIASTLTICFGSEESNWGRQVKEISGKSSMVGLIYIALAWFMGNGEIVAAGRDTYAQVAYWMQIFSIGWSVVFGVALFSKLWNKDKSLWEKALTPAVLYFVVAYLIH